MSDLIVPDPRFSLVVRPRSTFTIVARGGAAGTPGAVWRDGTGVPSNALGVDGDYYLNDANGDVFLKASGAYSVVANIKGATGPAGAAGAAGATGPAGPSNTIVDSTPTTLTSGVIADNTLFARSGANFVGRVVHDFTLKSAPDAADEILISDSAASNALKRATLASIPAVISRQGFPYLEIPASPDAWNFEARQATSADLLANGWAITLLDSPWTVQTRAGNVDFTNTPSPGTYRSTIIGGLLCIQLAPATNVVLYKAITNANFTYKARVWHTDYPTASSASHFGIATGPQRLTGATATYYTGIEGTTRYEVKLVGPGPGTFTIYTNTALATDYDGIDCVRVIDFTSGAGGNEKVQHLDARTGRRVLAPSNRLFTIAPAYAVVHIYGSSSMPVWLDFIRRTPYLSLP